MIGRFLRAAMACVALLYFGIAAAQSQRTEHTFKLDDPDNPPAATLADASLLIGSWISAWEDKQDHVTFRFIKAEENALHFSGISFYRISDNEMHAYIVMRSGDEVREEKLVYHRATGE